LHAVRAGYGAAGGIGDACGESRQRREERCGHAAEQRSAIDLHQVNSCGCSDRNIEAVEHDGNKATLYQVSQFRAA
jgi:hypothetical protein